MALELEENKCDPDHAYKEVCNGVLDIYFKIICNKLTAERTHLV